MRIILLSLTLIALLIPRQAKADDSWMWSHAGTTYAIQMVTYGISSQIFNIGRHQECDWDSYYNKCSYKHGDAVIYDRADSIIFSAAVTFLVTFTYSYIKTLESNSTRMPWSEIGMNAIGQGAAIGTIYTFRF